MFWAFLPVAIWRRNNDNLSDGEIGSLKWVFCPCIRGATLANRCSNVAVSIIRHLQISKTVNILKKFLTQLKIYTKDKFKWFAIYLRYLCGSSSWISKTSCDENPAVYDELPRVSPTHFSPSNYIRFLEWLSKPPWAISFAFALRIVSPFSSKWFYNN